MYDEEKTINLGYETYMGCVIPIFIFIKEIVDTVYFDGAGDIADMINEKYDTFIDAEDVVEAALESDEVEQYIKKITIEDIGIEAYYIDKNSINKLAEAVHKYMEE